jgi:hypothetical protein
MITLNEDGTMNTVLDEYGKAHKTLGMIQALVNHKMLKEAQELYGEVSSWLSKVEADNSENPASLANQFLDCLADCTKALKELETELYKQYVEER